MKRVWLAAVLVAVAGCASMELTTRRAEPEAFANPALLNCAAGTVPVCDVEGGRTRKYYSNCRCR